MPRNPSTGVFTRVANSFSNPVQGTVIDPNDADELFDDYDDGLTSAVPAEPTQVTTSSATIAAAAGAIAIVRTGPAATALSLPSVTARNGEPLSIFDWSASVVSDHTITITPDGAETIMKAANWTMISTATVLASITLHPSTSLNGWYIAP